MNSRARVAWKGLFELNDAPWRWVLALEAGFSMALTVGAFTLAGRQSLGLMASLGVFTILYCAQWSRLERALVLPIMGVGLVLASAAGVVCSTSIALNLLGLTLVTALASYLTLGFALGPPGPLMFVLVYGVSGFISAHVRAAGGPVPPLAIPLLALIGAALAYWVVVMPLLWSSVRVRREKLFQRWQLDDESKIIAARIVAAVILGGVLGAQLGVERIYWVAVAAMAVLQKSSTWHITNTRAMHRVFGTVLGLAVFAVLDRLEPSGWALVAVIAILQFSVELVVARNYGLALIFITPVALTISTAGHAPDLPGLMSARFLDTALGAGVALAVFWIGEALIAVRRKR